MGLERKEFKVQRPLLFSEFFTLVEASSGLQIKVDIDDENNVAYLSSKPFKDHIEIEIISDDVIHIYIQASWKKNYLVWTVLKIFNDQYGVSEVPDIPDIVNKKWVELSLTSIKSEAGLHLIMLLDIYFKRVKRNRELLTK